MTECYVVFTGDRKDKSDVISLFDEFAAPLALSLPRLDLGCPSSKLAPDEGMIDLKVRVIFGSAGSDILQQCIAFSQELDAQVQGQRTHGGDPHLCNRKVQEQGHIA